MLNSQVVSAPWDERPVHAHSMRQALTCDAHVIFLGLLPTTSSIAFEALKPAWAIDLARSDLKRRQAAS
jgi:hypothetical protein